MIIRRCKWCKGQIMYVPLTTGGTAPLDADPHPDGNVAVLPAGAMILDQETAAKGKAAGARRYRLHADTCKKRPRGARS